MPDIESFEIEMPAECSICLEDLGRHNLWKCKQCNNKFHKKCIIKWKKANPHYPEYFECPVCKLQYKNYCYNNCILRLMYRLMPIIIVFLLLVFIGDIIVVSCLVYNTYVKRH